MAGAGRLASAVWKTSSDETDSSYRFNLFVLDPQSGEANGILEPVDLLDIVKLVQVVAAELAVDGCMSDSMRMELRVLASAIDTITRAESLDQIS